MWGAYRLLNNSKETCREGHAKVVNDFAKPEILGAISGRKKDAE